VLGARIDRLAEREKHVLQTAAVIGKRFPQAVLERVVELPEEDLSAALSALEAAEFIYPEVLYPDPEYEFKHPLTQEVALGSQLGEKQRAVNEAVAKALIDVYPEKHDELAALIAQHFEHAGQGLEAARWHQRAARWAESNDVIQAASHWRKVLELAAPDAARELALESRTELLKGSFKLGLSRAEAEQLYREGLDLVDDDVADRVILMAWYARTINGLGDVREYLELARKMMESAEQTDDLQARNDAWAIYVDSFIFAGLWEPALENSEKVLSTVELSPKVAGFPSQGLWLFFRSEALMFLGRLDDAREGLARMMRIAAELDSPDLGYLGSFPQVWLAELAGDPGAALQAARRAAEYCEAAGAPPGYRSFVTTQLALAHLAAGNWGDAADTAREKLRLHKEERVELMDEPVGWLYLAEALLGSEDWEAAREAAVLALEGSRECFRLWVEIRALSTLALSRAHVEGPDADGLDALLDDADAVVERTATHALAPRIIEARATLAALRDDADLQRTHLQEAQRLYTEMNATGHAERVGRELEQPTPG
jgi:adenylate cyclase